MSRSESRVGPATQSHRRLGPSPPFPRLPLFGPHATCAGAETGSGAVAVELRPGREVVSQGGILALPDEETIGCVVAWADAHVELPPRVGHYLLLTLARARIADQEAGFGSLQAGWCYASDLCERLKMDATRLNIEVFRIRRQLATYGIPGSVIERRVGEQRLRLGCAHLVVLPDA